MERYGECLLIIIEKSAVVRKLCVKTKHSTVQWRFFGSAWMNAGTMKKRRIIENIELKLISSILPILIERFRVLAYNKARVWS